MNEREIFTAALEIKGEGERSQFLEVACSGDPPLRERVEAILAEHLKDDSFLLDSPPPGLGATDAISLATERPGIQLGPYKLLEQIGEGGMGVVFMAEQQEPVRRRVALKVIKPGMDTRQVIARFEAERQALTMMDHVSIARVLDAGATEAGRPYFVMELVHGVPITKYCDDNHLTPRERLELFMPVCQAIQHAHQKGIIHRDVKPSNVMITLYDGKPVPKVIDFGVAKATEQKLTERTLFTQYGTMVGTLEYMSPEQAEMSALGVDTRSDIYSLGVLLYELLTGSTPLSSKRMKEAAYAEILRLIKEEEPPKPSTRLSESGEALASISAQRQTEPAKLTKLMRGELDWIVMKTLEKDRNRRYETANGLAMDVERYLADEPVLACPPSARYRFGKFARRNRAALLTASLVALALVLGTVVSTWQAVRATRAEGLAEDRRAEAETQRKQAEANFQQARAAVDEYLTLVSESKLLDVPGLQSLRNDLLEAALRFYQKFAAERTNDPTALADLAVSYLQIAEVYSATDRNEEALVTFGRALDVVDRLLREYPEAKGHHRRLGGTWKGRRHAQTRADRPADRQAAQRSLERMIDTWRKLADEHTTVVGFQSDMAASYFRLGQLFGSEQPTEAAAAFKSARLIWEKLSQEHPTVAEYRSDLARACGGEAAVLRWAGRPKEIGPLLQQALPLLEQLVVEFPTVPQYRADLAEGLLATGAAQVVLQPRSAEKAYRRVVALNDGLVAEFPTVPLFREHLCGALVSLSNLLDQIGQRPDAEQARRRAIEVSAPLLTESPSIVQRRVEMARCLYEVGNALAKHQPQEAEKRVRRAVELGDALVAEFPKVKVYRNALADGSSRLAGLVRDKQGLGQAERLYRQAIALREPMGEAPPETRIAQANDYHELAFNQEGAKQLHEAELAIRASLALKLALVSEFPENRIYRMHAVHGHLGLGYIMLTSERKSDAVQAFSEATDILNTLAAEASGTNVFGTFLGQTLSQLGDAWLRLNRFDDAEQAYEQVLQIRKKLTVDFPDRIDYRNELADSYLARGDRLIASGKSEEAEKAYRQTFAVKAKLAVDFPDRPECSLDLGAVLWAAQRRQGSEQTIRLFIELCEGLVAEVPNAPDFQKELARCHNHLGLLLAAADGLQEAEQSHRRAEQIQRQALELCIKLAPEKDEHHRRELAWTYRNLGNVLNRSHQLADAEAAYRQALALCEKLAADFSTDEIYRNWIAENCQSLAIVLAASGRPEEAEKFFRRLVELNPKSARAYNDLAWLLATGPDPKFRDPKRAVELAQRAVELAPKEGSLWNTLGIAEYRAGEWKDGIDSLQKSDELLKGEAFAFNAFFLAMAHWQLDKKDEARKCYDQGVQWMEKNKPEDEELRRFREEAATLLNVEDQSERVPTSK